MYGRVLHSETPFCYRFGVSRLGHNHLDGCCWPLFFSITATFDYGGYLLPVSVADIALLRSDGFGCVVRLVGVALSLLRLVGCGAVHPFNLGQ